MKEERRGGFIPYVTAGDPGRDESLEILKALVRAGADVIELGIPFSDPLADGPTIQAATDRALRAGMTVHGVLDLVCEFRQSAETPIVLFTYFNPIFTYGYKSFLNDAHDAGADGLLILDLPPDEEDAGLERIKEAGLDAIRLIAPTTPVGRLPKIVQAGSGFLYFVSREGVTGERAELSADLAQHVAGIRAQTDLPVAVGFGISTPGQAAAVSGVADAAVVGSAIVRRIGEWGAEPDLAARVEGLVRPMAEAARWHGLTGSGPNVS